MNNLIKYQPKLAPHCSNKLHATKLALPNDQRSPAVLDAFASQDSLKEVLRRVMLASAVVTVSGTFLQCVFVAALHLNVGLSFLGLAAANVMTVSYFLSTLLPFALLLAWIHRYGKESPYQEGQINIRCNGGTAFENALAAIMTLNGARLVSVDERAGHIRATVSRSAKAGPQQIEVKVHPVSDECTLVNILSRPQIDPVQYMLVGYSLCVDHERNKRNVECIARFLEYYNPQTDQRDGNGLPSKRM